MTTVSETPLFPPISRRPELGRARETRSEEPLSADSLLPMTGKDAQGPPQFFGQAARELRRAGKIRLIEVAYHLNKTEGALSKFERGETTPHDLSKTVEIYAQVLDRDAEEVWKEIWERAWELWRRNGSGAG